MNEWTILAGFVLCAAQTPIWMEKASNIDEFWPGLLASVIGPVGMVCVIGFFVCMPLSQMYCESVRVEIEAYRQNEMPFNPIGYNTWIEKSRYWNNNGFDMFYPDWVDTIEPI